MPTKYDILNVLARADHPLRREQLAVLLGQTTYRTFQTQLDRFEKQEMVKQENHAYSILERGRLILDEIEVEKSVVEGRFLFSVTESELKGLGDEEFDEVWAALGKIIRKKAKQ